MKKGIEPTYTRTIRLPGSYWDKLRRLMQLQGRSWLERAIDREHKKLETKQ